MFSVRLRYKCDRGAEDPGRLEAAHQDGLGPRRRRDEGRGQSVEASSGQESRPSRFVPGAGPGQVESVGMIRCLGCRSGPGGALRGVSGKWEGSSRVPEVPQLWKAAPGVHSGTVRAMTFGAASYG